jgi:membrane protease YdiL (CAAX protease family)
MNLRNWFEHNPLASTAFIFLFLTLTVSNIYVRASENLLISMGIYGIENAIASLTIRFVISSLALILLYYTLYQQPRSIKEYRQKLQAVSGISWRTTIGCGLISFTIFAIVSASTLLLLGAFTDDPLAFLRQPSDTGAGWLWLLFAINPGLFEEMGFRGLLFTHLRRTYSEKTVIRLTAFLFGLFHFTGLANGESIVGLILISIMATSFGLSWGYMVAKTNSVVPSIMVHYLVNAFSEVLLQANTTKDELVLFHMLSMTVLYPILSYLIVRLMTQSEIPS